MKKILFCISLFIAMHAISQIPEGINYQRVGRDKSGQPIATQTISLPLTITNGNGGASVYKEQAAPVTNAFGLFTHVLGTGTIVSGNFSSITWSSTDAYLAVEADFTGGSNYVTMGSASPSVNTGFRTYSSGSQIIPTATMTQVEWPNEDYDDSNAFSNNAFTAPTAGVYHFDVYLMGAMNNQGLVNYFQELIIQKNGVDLIRTYGTNLQNAQLEYSFAANSDVKLNAGDVITVWVKQYSTYNMTIFPSSVYSGFTGHNIY